FREDDLFQRHNNIAKLLYIHALGTPAHLGQIEWLKLVATPRFLDKPLVYPDIMIFLDQNPEVLTLVTNALEGEFGCPLGASQSLMRLRGMDHLIMYAVGRNSMLPDLASETEKLLGPSNMYIRKKAALRALRVIKKVPVIADHHKQSQEALH
ncbi:uncharacterized protein LACBIDRAFT_254927, partial [Laccaria bicolor S238N-H82]